MARKLRLAVIGFALLVASSAVAGSNTVRVRVAPSTVTAGNSLLIAAGVRPAVKTCAATVARPGAAATKLAKKKATTGAVTWSWKVPRSAKGGSGTARVACPGAGAGLARFRITALPPPPPPVIPASVAVVKSGVAGRVSVTGSVFAGWGAVLQNVSPDEDAVDVDLVVNIFDAGGRILDTSTTFYEAIPAGATYYAGEDAIYAGSVLPARLEVTTRVNVRQKKAAIVMPVVSNVRVTEGFLGASVVGEVANPSTKTLDGLARVTVVCFDGVGNVIGGGYTYVPGSGLPPGGRALFDASIEGLSASQVASAQVSVEPEYES